MKRVQRDELYYLFGLQIQRENSEASIRIVYARSSRESSVVRRVGKPYSTVGRNKSFAQLHRQLVGRSLTELSSVKRARRPLRRSLAFEQNLLAQPRLYWP